MGVMREILGREALKLRAEASCLHYILSYVLSQNLLQSLVMMSEVLSQRF